MVTRTGGRRQATRASTMSSGTRMPVAVLPACRMVVWNRGWAGLEEFSEHGRENHGSDVVTLDVEQSHPPIGERVGRRARIRVADEGRLPECELRDPPPEAAGCFEREDGARGRPPEVGRATGSRDDRVDVLDLASDCVRQGVATVASAAPVVIEHGEVRGELLGKTDVRAPVG